MPISTHRDSSTRSDAGDAEVAFDRAPMLPKSRSWLTVSRRKCLSLLTVGPWAGGFGVLRADDEAVSAGPPAPAWGDLETIEIRSSLDGQIQPAKWHVPPEAKRSDTPILIFLHSWSGDYRQDNSDWLREASRRGWVFLHPDFRGPNRRPEACGSPLARQDVLDAIDFVASRVRLDPRRIYLAGSSGGGHMAMLMAGHHPERFSAVSAWVGISDLAAWHAFHDRQGASGKYAAMIRSSLGGRPGSSPEADARYVDRSPIHHLHRVGDLPLDLAAGVRDGKRGSVPIRQTLEAFNVVARARGDEPVSDAEIERLWSTGEPAASRRGDREADPAFPRAILLRRRAGASRVTIFDGDHEGLPGAACDWLGDQRRSALGIDPR